MNQWRLWGQGHSLRYFIDETTARMAQIKYGGRLERYKITGHRGKWITVERVINAEIKD